VHRTVHQANTSTDGRAFEGTVRGFRQKFTLDDAIGSHACSLEANMRVPNGIPMGCPLLLPVGTVNCAQTLKAVRVCMNDGGGECECLHTKKVEWVLYPCFAAVWCSRFQAVAWILPSTLDSAMLLGCIGGGVIWCSRFQT
jgi:hypothetical protein